MKTRAARILTGGLLVALSGWAQESPKSVPVVRADPDPDRIAPAVAPDVAPARDDDVVPEAGEGETKPVWELELDDEIEWFRPTAAGIVVAGSGSSLSGVDGISGRRLWTIPVVIEAADEMVEVVPTSIVVLLRALDAERAAAGDVPKEDFFRMAIDQFTGETLWRQDDAFVEQPLLALPVLSENSLFLKTKDPVSAAKVAKAGVGSFLLKGVPFTGKLRKKIATPNGGAYLLDLLTGEVRWRRELDGPDAIRYFAYGNRMVEQKLENLRGLDIATGEPVWKVGIEKKRIDVDEGELFLADGRSLSVLQLEAESKKALKQGAAWKIKSPKSLEKIREVAASGDTVYLAAREGFAAVDRASGDVRWTHVLDERGRPASLVISKDGTRALGSLYHWDSATNLRFVLIDTQTGAEVARYPEERTPKGKPTFMFVPADARPRWVRPDLFVVESEAIDLGYSIAGGRIEEAWQYAAPPPYVSPEDALIAAEKRKKMRRNAFLMIAGGVVLAGVLGDSGSDLARAVLLTGASVAVASGLEMLYRSFRSVEEIAAELPDSASRRALERFRRRQELLDPLVRADLVAVEGSENPAIQLFDLRTGEIVHRIEVPGPGNASIDSAFQLVYQRPSDNHSVLMALQLPEYSPQVLQDFQLAGL